MAPKTKNAERNAQRRAAKKAEEEEPAPVSKGSPGASKMLEAAKAMFLGSCLLQFAPRMPDLLKPKEKCAGEESEVKKDGDAPAEATDENADEQKEGEDSKTAANDEDGEATSIFASLTTRLAWYNSLGLAFPESGEDAMKKWVEMKSLELDWGPKASRRGTPKITRILANVDAFMAQYLHILLVLMMLRAFLFRSYFSCLPWCFALQLAALLVPIEMAPQVPLKFRVAGALGFHALVWLFFALEVVWRTWFFEKIFVLGLFAFHAHSVRPNDA